MRAMAFEATSFQIIFVQRAIDGGSGSEKVPPTFPWDGKVGGTF